MGKNVETDVRNAVEALGSVLIEAIQSTTVPASAVGDRLYSIDETCQILGCGRTLVYKELTAGRLRSFKVGRRRLVPESAIVAFIDADGRDGSRLPME